MTDPETPMQDNLFRPAPPAQASPAAAPARTILKIDGAHEPTSARVLAHVAANPGATIRQVAVALGFSHATSSYHLQSLVRNGLACRVSDGRDVRFFPAGQYSVASHLRVLVSDPPKLQVARFLVESADRLPDLTLNETARRLGLPFGFLKRTLLQFERIGFVYLSRRGVRYIVSPVPQALTRDVLALLRDPAPPTP